MNILAIIPARSGSKGVKNKNSRELAGRPLIEYAIRAARQAAGISRLIISTDDQGIADIAAALNVKLEIRNAMHENDRLATGYLPPAEFERVADAFFANPAVSVRGWERAVDAQKRIVKEMEAVLGRNKDGDILFVGHGAVGTLLFCHYSKLTIDRSHDQTGSGNYFSLLLDGRRVLHPWRKMEEPPMSLP